MPLSRMRAARITGIPAGRTTKWIVLVVWLAVIATAAPLASQLSDVQTKDDTAELPGDAESTEVERLADRFRDADVSLGIVVYARGAGINAADRAKAEADRRAFAPLAVERIRRAARIGGRRGAHARRPAAAITTAWRTPPGRSARWPLRACRRGCRRG